VPGFLLVWSKIQKKVHFLVHSTAPVEISRGGISVLKKSNVPFKKPKIWIQDLEGWGYIDISWYPGPYGDAIYDLDEKGIGYFGPSGEILSVELFNVSLASDHQVMQFDNRFKNRVEVTVKKGKVSVKLSGKPARKKIA